jgi:nucleoside-diphosphate-sugar epimerase
MKVFVAGASGAIGRRLIPQLQAAGHSVVGVTRDPAKAESLRGTGVDAVVCDVFDRPALTAAVAAAAPGAIIQQLTDLPAALNPRRLKAIYERNNRVRREGTANLIAAGRTAGVPRIVVQSMATWYRPDDHDVQRGPALEGDALWTDAPEPIGEAVRTVAQMEAAALREVPLAVILRYGAFYGPGTWYGADGDVAERVRKRQLPIVGSGSGVTSFIHIDDAASAAVAALDAQTSGVFNIVDNEPAPAREWMPAYARALDAPPPRRVPVLLARLLLGNALTEWVTTMRGASNRAAISALGWKPGFPSWREGFAASLVAGR